jgi:adenylate cyclase
MNDPVLREATILFADLRLFSARAYTADVVLGVLSSCLSRMTEMVMLHGGNIEKFVGDAIMVVFHQQPAPRDHAQSAIQCAVEIQIAMNELRQQHKSKGLPEVYLGIGISTGAGTAGEELELAARIKAFSLRGQVLVSENTSARCRDFADFSAPTEVYVKGRSERLRVREVRAIPRLGKTVPRQDARKSPRVEVNLTLYYQPVIGNTVDSPPRLGHVRDLSYHGALAQLPAPLPLHSEVVLAFHMASLDYRADKVRARVVSAREQAGFHLAGLEFISLSEETSHKIELFVQMCLHSG